MKRKHTIIFLSIILVAIFILGISGGVTLAKDQPMNSNTEDQLVGIFVTEEYLDLFPDSFTGGSGDLDEMQPRLYADIEEITYYDETTETTRTRMQITFGNVEGYVYLTYRSQSEDGEDYTISYGDDIFYGGGISISETDEGTSIVMEGVITVSSDDKSILFYFNPVYQTADGDIYTVGGSAFEMGNRAEEGDMFSHNLNTTHTETVNGITRTDTVSVEIQVRVKHEPKSINIIQMTAQNNVISEVTYSPGTLPQSIQTDPKTEYLIVETTKSDVSDAEITVREIYAKPQDAIVTDQVQPDGIFVQQTTKLIWTD